ncbi:hypothetical protein Pmani_008438 [Petrolisthes manimaculis]|uniref:Uncharacterized protein n=1 Tax=Petrolisthes manimaculis TaxID=1843537 RepID=A0AAE1UEN0_9EUCA|nr:hypothetical protein Pmani_008430 [Petrolisthes manimaculis]KAK4320732.1 hypothetical protein Pmani_008438 [Petrolisthes manimaculis]
MKTTTPDNIIIIMETPTSDTKPQIMEKENQVEFDLVAWVDQDEEEDEDCNESQNEDEDCNESEDEDEDCNESQNEDEDCNESEDEDEEVEFDLLAWVDQDEDENSNESQDKDENSNESQDEDSSSESEPTPIHSYLNQINKKWDRMVMKDISPQTKHLVQFGDVKIHRLIHWQFAYQEARKSLWGQCVRDRNRFHRRIQQIEPILSKILNPDHRIRIQYKLKLISSDHIN